jgi:hypothetical protein
MRRCPGVGPGRRLPQVVRHGPGRCAAPSWAPAPRLQSVRKQKKRIMQGSPVLPWAGGDSSPTSGHRDHSSLPTPAWRQAATTGAIAGTGGRRASENWGPTALANRARSAVRAWTTPVVALRDGLTGKARGEAT